MKANKSDVYFIEGMLMFVMSVHAMAGWVDILFHIVGTLLCIGSILLARAESKEKDFNHEGHEAREEKK